MPLGFLVVPHVVMDPRTQSVCFWVVSWLDFTQNLEEATDAITLGRRHSWLESEGFSLSAANADVQELPATCTIELQPLSLTPLKMRKVEPGYSSG